MQKKMSLALAFLLVVSMFALPMAWGSEHEVLFEREFLKKQTNDPKGFGIKTAVYMNGMIYVQLMDKIFTQKYGEKEPMLLCNIPRMPEWTQQWWDTPLEQFPDAEREALSSFVSTIFDWNGTLWGINMPTGKVGKIDENGISWQEQRMDVSAFYKKGTLFGLFLMERAFVYGDHLYLFGDSEELGNKPRKLLARLDLKSGHYSKVDIQNAYGMGHYKEGLVLLAQGVDKRSSELNVLELATGKIEPMHLKIPFPDASAEYASNISGLLFDEKNDRIFFTHAEGPVFSDVWQSVSGKAFEKVLSFPHFIVDNTDLWIMPDGRYAFEDSGDGIFFYEIK